MERDKKPLTAQEKLEMDLMAEAELAKLQRQYRLMETDRKAFTEETSAILTKQKQIINGLQQEQQNILTDLKVATCELNKKKDVQALTQLNNLLDDHDTYTSTLQKETAHLKEINDQIKKLEKRVSELRAKEVPDLKFKNTIINNERSVKILENQLETQIKRFCVVLNNNRILREEIDHLLKERTRFNTIWENLLEELSQGKKLLLELVEQATIAYDQREEWGSKLRALKVRTENDHVLHAQEMKELQRELDRDNELYDFLGVKGQKRIMRDLEQKELKKKEMQRDKLHKELVKYQEMLTEIQVLVHEEDNTRLASLYYKQEEENFALFNYVNELTHEIEVVTDSVKQLKKEIDAQRELNRVREQQQEETVVSLQEDLTLATKNATDAQNVLKQTENEFQELLKSIVGLFVLSKCDNKPILQLLGDDATIDQYNVMLYLGILEKKIGELTHNMYLKEKSGSTKRKKPVQVN